MLTDPWDSGYESTALRQADETFSLLWIPQRAWLLSGNRQGRVRVWRIVSNTSAAGHRSSAANPDRLEAGGAETGMEGSSSADRTNGLEVGTASPDEVHALLPEPEPEPELEPATPEVVSRTVSVDT